MSYMDHLIIWSLMHNQLARQRIKPTRCDDEFYRGSYRGDGAWQMMSSLWPGLKRSR